MDMKVQTIHFDADKKLLDYVDEKVSKLKNYTDDIVATEVILKLNNNSELDNKITEILLYMPGKDLFVKKQSKSFEDATDQAVEALTVQIKKQKEKMRGI